MRSRGNGSLRRRKSVFVDSLIFFLYFREYIGEEARSGGAREATSLLATAPLVAATGLVGPVWLSCLGPQVPRSSSVLEKFISGILFRLDSVPKSDTPPKRITSDRSPWRSWRTLYWRSKREKKPSKYYLRTRRSEVNYSRVIGGAMMLM